MNQREPVSVTILGGFLGAGKTTVLNHLLHGSHGRRIGVIVNDFGQVNIDAKLVVGLDGDTIDLANGCVCCSLRDEFVVAVQRLMARPQPPQHIVIEASGVSDPAAIARGFDAPGLGDLVRLDAVLVVVDAEHHLHMRARERIVAAGQLKTADIVVLNKVDLVDAATLRQLETSIQRVVARARVYPTAFGRIASEVFFGETNSRPGVLASSAVDEGHDHVHGDHAHGDHGRAPHEHAHRDHHAVFESWSVRTEAPLSSRRLRRFIEGLPPQIYRAKGIVRLMKDRGRRAVLHVVGRRAELSLGAPWGEELPHSELVFIGMPGALDPIFLQRELDACTHAGSGGEPSSVMHWLRRWWA